MFEKLFSTMAFKDLSDRKRIQIFFEWYLSGIPDTFYLNQFELAKACEGSTYEDWVRILRHPAFASWKSEQIAIIATTSTDKALAGGTEDANSKDALNLLKMRQDVLNSERKADKPTIIVMPESLFFRGVDDK